MLGQIIKIEGNNIYIKLNNNASSSYNLINLYILIQDSQRSFIAEIISIDNDIATANLIGEYTSNGLIYGFIKKPSINCQVNLIDANYIGTLINEQNDNNNSLYIGKSSIYDNVNVNGNINKLFGSHSAIFGNTGSGKSCGFARIIQNLLAKDNISSKMNLIIFDAYGEYHDAFKYLNDGPKYGFKSYTTDTKSIEEKLCLPIWFFDVDDYAILLGAEKKSQLSIIEKALRYVDLFKKPEENVKQYKNSIIADALLDIVLSGRPAAQIRDQFTSALTKYNTADLNLETPVTQPGYTRTLRQCLLVDENNKINAIELVSSFLQGFLCEQPLTSLPDGSYPYTLEDLSYALDFALINEGIWKSDKVFDEVNVIKVHLDSLINSDTKTFFNYPEYISLDSYLNKLVITKDNRKAQIINFNINYIDDRLAKNIVKIYSKLFYNYTKNLNVRSSFPINIILEESHRYVQNDDDINIIGYNIFERIAKEGRKYGILLTLISQRPCELSETCLSQCSNFILFKITHPFDISYITKVVPNINDEIIEKIKTLLPGNCMVFGNAFKIPTLVKLDMPNPSPNSDNVALNKIWFE